jgi:hypothetical protein
VITINVKGLRYMRRTFVSLCAAALLTTLAATPAAAATLRLEFTDLDVSYNSLTGDITDATDPLGGEMDPSEADALATLDFFLDGVKIGSLDSNIWADLAIIGVDPIPTAGGSVVNAYGGTLDILFGLDQGIALDLSNVQFFLFAGGAILTGTATADLFQQILVPFNVAFDPTQPIDVLFALGPLANTASSGGFFTGFDAEGTGSITGDGTVVPEPTSMLLLGSGLLAAAAARRRARPRQ